MTNEQVKNSLMTCDTQLLSLEILQQMEKYAPDKREVRLKERER